MSKKVLMAITLLLLPIYLLACARADTLPGVESSITETNDISSVKVTADTANIRSGCSADAPVLQSNNQNDRLDVVNEVGDWYAVQLPEDQIGFVSKDTVTPVIPEEGETEPTGSEDNPVEQTGPANTPGTTSPQTDNTGPEATSLTADEQEMLRLVNEARSQNNVPPLEADLSLTNVARIKSQDMIDNNYFSHNSPTYGSPFDMMKSFNINYVQGGENIAGNRDVPAAHEALMNSPGHRKNILSPDFTHIGIGIQGGGQYGNMFTQMFISKPQ
jgi:uncharacterized YkwD family protein